MKILFVCHEFPYPPHNGYCFLILETIRHLHAIGADVTALAMYERQKPVILDALPATVKSWADYYAVEINLTHSPLEEWTNALFKKGPISIEKYDSDGFMIELEKVIRKEKFDIIQVEGIYLAQYLPDIRALSNAKVLLRVYGLEYPLMMQKAAKAPQQFKKSLYQIHAARMEKYEWEVLLGGGAHAILTTDTYWAQLIQAKAKSTFGARLVPIFTPKLGMNFDNIPLHEGLIQDYSKVFYVGDLENEANQRGLSWFIENVWSKCYKLYPHVQFIIAVRNRPPRFLSGLDTAMNLVWMGEVPDLYTFMQTHGIMVVPIPFYAGFQPKILEGMANGVTVIASRAAMQGNPAKHGESVLIADDVEEYMNLIGTCIEHPNIAATIGKNAKAIVRKNFDLATCAQELLAFYASR